MNQKSPANYPLPTTNFRKGFTLVELLITMAVIGILSIGGLASYKASNVNARNARRQSDMEDIRQALELHRSNQSGYPTNYKDCDSSVGAFDTFECNDDFEIPPGSVGTDWGSTDDTLRDILTVDFKYTDQLPKDPLNTAIFYYHYEPICAGDAKTICGRDVNCTSTCCAYELEMHLENIDGTSTKREFCNP